MSTSNGRGEGAAPFPGSAEPVQHRPGAWPEALQTSVCTAKPSAFEPDGEARMKVQAERARRAIVLEQIRFDLEAEPTARAVQEARRRWCRYIVQLADDIAKAKVSDR
jgi:hypothetical protein